MEKLVRVIVQALVDHPEKVCVNKINGSKCYVIELQVAYDDMGKIIGRQRRTADAIRIIINAIAAKENKRGIFQIADYHPISRCKVSQL